MLSFSHIKTYFSVVFSACVPDSPCLNGGSCKEDGKGGYLCECAATYSGRLCEQHGNIVILLKFLFSKKSISYHDLIAFHSIKRY